MSSGTISNTRVGSKLPHHNVKYALRKGGGGSMVVVSGNSMELLTDVC